jgi:hypothetical protein
MFCLEDKRLQILTDRSLKGCHGTKERKITLWGFTGQNYVAVIGHF